MIIDSEASAAVAGLLSLIVPAAICMVLGFISARRNGEDVW